MELPALRLTVEKGPRKGETIECKAGAVARVGRVVKGNNLAVRDPGASQKHLVFQFLHEASRWAVSDLDTSNGTLVNDGKIPPSAPFPLSDGDTVKIGEATAIGIKILAAERRDFVDDDDEKERRGMGRRMGRPRKGAPPLPVVYEEEVARAEGGGGQRGKGRPRKKVDAVASVAVAPPAVPEKDEISEPPAVEESVGEEMTEVVEAKGRVRGRRHVTRYTAANVSEDKQEMKESTSVHVADSEAVQASEAVEKRNVIVESEEGGKWEEPARDEEEELGKDMDSMTLGDWFDRMEKFFPLMINDVAKEIIVSLRDKAQRFDEFIATSSTSC